MKNNIHFFLKYYFPAVFWAGLIFYVSGVPHLEYSSKITQEIILRKGAHFLEYAILTWLVFRIFYFAHKMSFGKSFWLTFLLASAYAFTDEFHQSFVSGRSGRLDDAVYDAISVFVGLEMLAIFIGRKISWKIGMSLGLAIIALIGLEYKMVREGQRARDEKSVSNERQEEERARENPPENPQKLAPAEEAEKKASNLPKNIPDKILIKVPFTSQAPHKNWDEYHQEACEEASLVMLKYYLKKKSLDKETAEKEIQALIAYQIKKHGDYKDTNAEQTKKLAEEFYGINNLKVIYDFQPEDIREYLSLGNPIIVPAAGRRLGNPNFTAPGPLYHNLVITGYDKDTIITNDPGTRKGENYKYELKTLYDAIHDFPGRPEDIEKGRKAMIVLEK